MKKHFSVDERLGIPLPNLTKAWEDYLEKEQQEILVFWETIRGRIPDRIALFVLPRAGRLLSKLKPPVYALFILIDSMETNEHTAIIKIKRYELVNCVAETKGLT